MPESGFPTGVHLGGANAAITLAELAREFYAPIIPPVMELRRQGLSLRAIGRELARRGVKTRWYQDGCWSAAQVRRVLIRGGGTPVAPPPPPPPARAVPPVAPPPKVAPAPPPAEPADIRLWIGSQAVGPFTAAQVKTMLADGRITLDTTYFREGMSGFLRELIGELMA